MTNEEKEALQEVRLTQATTSSNLKQVTEALDSMASVLHEQSISQAVTANNVTHIKEVIDGIPSVIEIKKDVEMLKTCRRTFLKVVVTLVTTAIVGFTSYMFVGVTGR